MDPRTWLCAGVLRLVPHPRHFAVIRGLSGPVLDPLLLVVFLPALLGLRPWRLLLAAGGFAPFSLLACLSFLSPLSSTCTSRRRQAFALHCHTWMIEHCYHTIARPLTVTIYTYIYIYMHACMCTCQHDRASSNSRR